MSGMSLPVQRPAGQALLVAGPGNRAQPARLPADAFDALEDLVFLLPDRRAR